MKLPWMSSEHVARDVSDRSADQLPPSEVVGFLRRGRSFHPWQLEVVYGRSDVPPSHRPPNYVTAARSSRTSLPWQGHWGWPDQRISSTTWKIGWTPASHGRSYVKFFSKRSTLQCVAFHTSTKEGYYGFAKNRTYRPLYVPGCPCKFQKHLNKLRK